MAGRPGFYLNMIGLGYHFTKRTGLGVSLFRTHLFLGSYSTTAQQTTMIALNTKHTGGQVRLSHTTTLLWTQTHTHIDLRIPLDDAQLQNYTPTIHHDHLSLTANTDETIVVPLAAVVVVDDSTWELEDNPTQGNDTAHKTLLFTLRKAVPALWTRLRPTDPEPAEPPRLIEPTARKEPRSRADLLASAKARIGGELESSKAQKYAVEGLRDATISLDELPPLAVVSVRDCSGSTIRLPASSSAVKFYVESCDDCSVQLDGKVITETLEIWRCHGVKVHVGASPVKTVQVDESSGLELAFARRALFERLYTSGARSTVLSFGDAPECGGSVDFDALQREHASAGTQVSPETDQFITRLVDGALLTELIIRLSNDFPTTEREVAEFARATSMAKDKVDDVVATMVGSGLGQNLSAAERDQMRQMVLDHSEQADAARAQAERTAEGRLAARVEYKRRAGNEAYSSGDYQQAAVLYSEALALDDTVVAILSNRAAAFLKLGRYAQARADAERAASLKPDFAKAHFRLALALQAQEAFGDACASFSRCLQIEPKNKEATAGLRMAEVQAERQRRTQAAQG